MHHWWAKETLLEKNITDPTICEYILYRKKYHIFKYITIFIIFTMFVNILEKKYDF